MESFIKKIMSFVEKLKSFSIKNTEAATINNESIDSSEENEGYTLYWSGKTKYSKNISEKFTSHDIAMKEYNRQAKIKGRSYVELIVHRANGANDSLARLLNPQVWYQTKG